MFKMSYHNNQSMLQLCGQAVGSFSTTCVQAQTYTPNNLQTKISLGKTTNLYNLLSNFCTQLMNPTNVNFLSVKQHLYTLSTPPIIKITFDK